MKYYQESNISLPSNIKHCISNASSIVVLTGAGISAESGVPTFRGREGLWNNFRPEQLATPSAFAHDPELVWNWYAWRRELISTCDPNPGHHAIASMESSKRELVLITQNVDGLHQRAGNEEVIELHGNIWRMRCPQCCRTHEDHSVPLVTIPPLCKVCGSIPRPDVVWFGESLDSVILKAAFHAASKCDLMIVAGTSAVVQPAATIPLIALENKSTVLEVNLEMTPLSSLFDHTILGKAGEILTGILSILEHR